MKQPRCAYCDEIIGVDEPVRVMLGDGTELKGSSLTLGDQLKALGSYAPKPAATISGAKPG